MPLIIAIAGRKGGVGKTTIACGLASLYASEGLETVVCDLDPQSNAAFAFGVDPAAPGTAALLTDGAEPQSAAERLYVFPGGPALTEASIQRLHPEELADALSQAPVDVAICDCPPGSEHLERLGVTAAQVCLVVADAHPFAAIGAGRVLDDLESNRERGRKGPDRWAVVLSRLDPRRSADRRLTDHAADAFGDVPRLSVRQDAAIAAATSDQRPIAESCRGSRGLEDLMSVKEWVDGKNR